MILSVAWHRHLTLCQPILPCAHAMILAERAARIELESKLVDARAVAARAQAEMSSTEAFIAHLKLEIEKLRRELYGHRSERKARLLEQMELQLEDLEAGATEDELAAEKAAARTQQSNRSSASDLRASRSPSICRASASSSPPRNAALAAARRSCRSWARISPRRWR